MKLPPTPRPKLVVMVDGDEIKVVFYIRNEWREENGAQVMTQVADPDGPFFITVATINGYNHTFTKQEQMAWAQLFVKAANAAEKMKLTTKEWLRRICCGVNWGKNSELRLVPLHPEQSERTARYFIFSKAGHTGWSGVGDRDYYPANHEVLDMTKDTGNGYNDYHKCRLTLGVGVAQVEGRLTKAKIEEWRKYFKK